MEAETNGSAAPWHQYGQYDWGDYINGTKAQLQALGLGFGRKFPGEPGGPKRLLNVRDPRGCAARIERYNEDGLYAATITFTDWPERPPFEGPWVAIHPGVKRRGCTCCVDEYRGSAEDLTAAGIVPAGHFPGMPGMRKTLVTILADGSIPTSHPNANIKGAHDCGAMQIKRVSARVYSVKVSVSDDENERRRKALEIEVATWRRTVRSLQRPPKLTPRFATKLQHLDDAYARAIEDTGFQAMLAQVIGGASDPRGGARRGDHQA